jgi:hypothetical protein
MQICAASIKKNVEGLLESKQKGNLLPPRATAACETAAVVPPQRSSYHLASNALGVTNGDHSDFAYQF